MPQEEKVEVNGRIRRKAVFEDEEEDDSESEEVILLLGVDIYTCS